MRPRRSLSPLLRWLGFAALAQVLCAHDTRRQVRDLCLVLPEASPEEDPTQRPTRPSQCTTGRRAGMDLLLPMDTRWGKPIATVAQLESPAARERWAVRSDLRAAPPCKARLLDRYRALDAEGSWTTTSVRSELFTECIGLSSEDLLDSLDRRRETVDLGSGGIYAHGGHRTFVLAWWLRRELDGAAGGEGPGRPGLLG